MWIFTSRAGRITVVGSTMICAVVSDVEPDLAEDAAKLRMAESVYQRI